MTILEPYLTYAKIGAVIALLAGAVVAGATINGYRWQAKYDAHELEASQTRYDAAQGAAARMAARYAAKDLQGAAQGRIAAEAVRILAKDSNELDRLRTCLADGSCRLSVNPALCPTSAGNVPQPSTSGGVGTGAGGRSAAQVEQDYLDFRADLTRVQTKLAAAQKAIKVCTGQ